MNHEVKRISVDTTALPAENALFGKIFPIIKKRMEDRCGVVCCENDKAAQYILRFVLDDKIPAEGFRLCDESGALVVRGADPVPEQQATLEDGLARVEVLREQGASVKDAVKQAARELDLSKNELYALALGR